MANYVNESSTMTVRARFYSAGNAAATPITARYRISDLTNERIVKDWTTLEPASDISFEIDAADNEMYENARRPRQFESRVITMQANAGLVTQYTQEIKYWVRNMHGITEQD